MAGARARFCLALGSVRSTRAIALECGDFAMPLVQVKLVEGVFSDAQKQEMIRKLTDAMVSIEGEAMRAVTWVVVEEVKSGSWGIGGKALTTDDIKALARGK
jgi:4-oxalocrotonate tautomerase